MLFCIYFHFVPIPVSMETFQMYVQFLSREFHSVTSIRNYVNGAKLLHLYKSAAFPHIGDFELNMLYRGLKRTKSHIVKQALPITFDICLNIFPHVDCKSPLDATLWCCFVLAFFLFARKSNLVPPSGIGFNKDKHLQRGDILQASCGLIVRFKWSKTIQFGERHLPVPISTVPGSVLCPVLAYLNMCKMTPTSASRPAFVFPKKWKIGKLNLQPIRLLFKTALELSARKRRHVFRPLF